MGMKDLLYIFNYKNKDDEEKTIWTQIGTCFGSNKDGSRNITLNVPVTLRPGDKLQLRDRVPKDEEGKEEAEF